MRKILRMLIKFKRLQKEMQRQDIWNNIKKRDESVPQYRVVTINKATRDSVEKDFVELKSAVNYIYPSCKTMYNHEFYIFHKGKFLILNPVNP